MNDIYDIETKEDAINAYAEHFGGFPYYLFMGAEEDVIIDAVVKAIETDRIIEPKNDEAVY
jgi:hypothetical protein